jgi:hypothetical protein
VLVLVAGYLLVLLMRVLVDRLRRPAPVETAARAQPTVVTR